MKYISLLDIPVSGHYDATSDTLGIKAMTATAKLFTLGKSQAVRIPARFRLHADAVEITECDGALILRPKPRTALDVLNAARAHLGNSKLMRPVQGETRPLPSFD